jgi:P4 family phage/plasmid primase-like protien
MARPDIVDEILARTTEGDLYLCSLPNVKGEAPTRSAGTRQAAAVRRFCKKHDVAGRGVFFSVGTIRHGQPRRKENALQVCAIHADIDFKSVDGEPADIAEAITDLGCRPSLAYGSGNGIHLYWLLEQPTSDLARAEALMKKVAAVVAGDKEVTHSVALMRVPGTHNTKRGERREVQEVEVLCSREAYHLEELERWIDGQRPAVRRREAEQEPGNPFLQVAADQSFRPPMDASERLRAMRPGAGGDNGIHATQLAVTASLMSAGEDVDEIVAQVLEETRAAAGEDGEGWNWAEEERVIRRMCTDWERKHPRAQVRRAVREDTGAAGASVVNLAEARAERKKITEKPKAHAILGAGILRALEQRGEKIILTREQLWRYRDGLWRTMTPQEARQWVEAEVEVGCQALNLPSKNSLVNETRGWLMRSPDVWQDEVPWDEHGKIMTRSGLLDPRDRTIQEARPEHLATHRLEAEYDPRAKCPWWRRMLEDAFADRTAKERKATIGIIQEILGMALLDVKPRSLMRALVLVGPSDSGKSSLLAVMAGLLSEHVISTPFEALENAHGTVAFLRRAPWVLHEAFDQAKWHFSSTAKALLSGDHISVNVKNGPIVTHQFRSAVLWGTNVPPQFREATKAIVNRMVVVSCNRVFEEPMGAALEARSRGMAGPADLVLREERAGLLNWALDGMDRATARGRFELTEGMEELLHQVRMESNLVAGFLEECCEFDPRTEVSTSDFCASFAMWWSGNRGEGRGTPSNDAVGRAVSALADPRIGKRVSHNLRLYRGIKLNEVGLDYWQGALGSDLAAGRLARLSSSRREVNRPVLD